MERSFSMEGLLFSSDVEVGAYKPRDGVLQELIPPSYLIHALGVKPKYYLDEEKTKPVLTVYEPDELVWFQDGALYEVAFNPVSTPTELWKEVRTSITVLDEFLEPFGYKTLFAPVGEFDLEKYKNFPDIVQACISGCNPDKNALIEGYRSNVVDISDWGVRGMGGHIHMSLPKDRWDDSLHMYERMILRLMVITAGNSAVLTNTQPELELVRLERFGHPGSYRTPIYADGVYGFEYRAPSSSWLNSEESISLMYKAISLALHLALENREEAREVINFFLEESVNSVLEQNKTQSEQILTMLELI
jgi:hypothetical protein